MGADLAYLTTGDSADPLVVSRRQREIAPASQIAPLERLATFTPANSATGIRAFFGGTTGIGPAPTLLQLQRRYGNRYVQRLVAPAAVQRKCAGGGHAHSGGNVTSAGKIGCLGVMNTIMQGKCRARRRSMRSDRVRLSPASCNGRTAGETVTVMAAVTAAEAQVTFPPHSANRSRAALIQSK